jgi:hypothetical protein
VAVGGAGDVDGCTGVREDDVPFRPVDGPLDDPPEVLGVLLATASMSAVSSPMSSGTMVYSSIRSPVTSATVVSPWMAISSRPAPWTTSARSTSIRASASAMIGTRSGS